MAKQKQRKLKEQQLLFAKDSLLPVALSVRQALQPAPNLSALFEECHNYIYANEGLLKEKIFHEFVKLLVMKLHDEQTDSEPLQFGITQSEYRHIHANQSSAFEKRLDHLYQTVRAKFPALLTDERLTLKPLTLGHVVSRLQSISLTRTPGDIKGEAFQTFTYRHQRGDRGEFFTPHPIVRLAVEMIDPQPNETVIDPACGSGGFLIQTIAHIAVRNVRRNVPSARIDLENYVRRAIRGIEFNPDVALAAMIRLAFEGGTGAEITCANALLENRALENQFDLALTNPPFGNKGKVEDQRILKPYWLARRWNKNSDHSWKASNVVLPGQSPDILFIEQCLKFLKPGGRMAIVLPDGILQNVSNSSIRYWMRAQAQVMGVVSIPQEAFVPYGTGIKTSLLLLQKNPAPPRQFCFMARLEKIGYDVKAQPIYKKDSAGRYLKNAQGILLVDDDVETIASGFASFKNQTPLPKGETIYTVPNSELNSRLDAEHYRPSDQEMLAWLARNGGKRLSEIADIVSAGDDFRLTSENEIRYIAISDVDARTMQVVSQQILRAHEAPSRATYRVQSGDIITATSGASTGTTRQATALITEDEDGAICSNGFAVLRNIHGVEPLYLLAYLQTEFFLRQVRRLMTGHAIPAISNDDLATILVPIPARAEQKRIADAIADIMMLRKETLKQGVRIVTETENIIRSTRMDMTILRQV